MASKYWEDRVALRQLLYDRAGDNAMRTISAAYNRAIAQLTADAEKIIGTFAWNNSMTPLEAKMMLASPASDDYIATLRARAMTVSDPRQQALLNRELNAYAYRGRITRLEALQESMRVGMTQAADIQLQATTGLLRSTGRLAYNRTMFDIQQGAGIGFSAVTIPDKKLAEIMRNKWSGMHYSTRVWNNRNEMVDVLQKALNENMSIGKASSATFAELKELANGSKSSANRILRSETSYVTNQVIAQTYEDAGIAKYEFVSVLDGSTSKVCRDHDGETFNVSEKVVGDNYPPLHPWCRSTTSPVLNSTNKEEMTRWARDPETGKVSKVPATLSYNEWIAWQKAGAPNLQEWRAKQKKDVLNSGVLKQAHPVDGGKLLPFVPDPEKYPDIINEVVARQGFDGTPTVVTREKYDEMVASGKYPYMRRGYRADSKETLDMYHDSLVNGKWYIDCSEGGSAYGKGMYTATAPGVSKEVDSVAMRYGSARKGTSQVGYIEYFTEDPSAKFIKANQIEDAFASYLNKDIVRSLPEYRQELKDAYIEAYKQKELKNYAQYGNLKYEYATSREKNMEWRALEAKIDELEGIYEDEGVQAAMLGYDGIDVSHPGTADYRVVLNRTKLIVCEVPEFVQ